MRKITLFLFLFGVVLIANNIYAADARFGLDILRNMASPKFQTGNYRLDPDFTLGLGDTVKLSLWGKLEATHELTVDRDGNLVVPLIGRVSLLGLTLEQAREAIRREIDKKYTNVEFDLSLVNVQDIRIEVLGHVGKPGVYAVSPFARLVDAVAEAGGPDNFGSLIDIRLIREGKVVATFNFYDFLRDGNQTQNITLKHNDIIFIPIIKNIVTLAGEFRYPGTYEVGDNATLKDAIELAGGIETKTLKQKIYVLRVDPATKRKVIFKEVVFDRIEDLSSQDNAVLNDWDAIRVSTSFDFRPFEEELLKKVTVSGEVQIPGEYLIQTGDTLLHVLKRAGGLKDTAFAQGGVFIRQQVKEQQQSLMKEMVNAQKIAYLEQEAILAGTLLSESQREFRQTALEARKRVVDLLAAREAEGRIIIDLEEILEGNGDIILEKDDSVFIPQKPDWVLVIGEVYNAQSIAFQADKSVDYYLNIVGGLKKTADRDEIYIVKPSGRTESKVTGFGKIGMGDIIVVPKGR